MPIDPKKIAERFGLMAVVVVAVVLALPFGMLVVIVAPFTIAPAFLIELWRCRDVRIAWREAVDPFRLR